MPDPTPTLEVVSPTTANPPGGLFTGQNFRVMWRAGDVKGRVQIDLYRGQQFLKTLTRGPTASSGRWTWKVRALPPGAYRLRVASRNNPAIADFSEGFVLGAGAGQPWVQVTSPAAPETWIQDETHRVQWQSANVKGMATVRLLRDGALVKTLGKMPIPVGFLEWTVDVGDPGDYVIQVAKGRISDYSAPIRIEPRTGPPPAPLPAIDALLPTSSDPPGGIVTGGGFYVVWSSMFVPGRLQVDLYRGDQFIKRLTKGALASKGFWFWKPRRFPAGTYRLKLTSRTLPTVMDFTEDFAIVPGPGQQWIAVTSPSAPDTWMNGELRRIEWDSANVTGKVTVKLLLGGSRVATLGKVPVTDGFLDWTVAVPGPGEYVIEVKKRSIRDVGAPLQSQ